MLPHDRKFRWQCRSTALQNYLPFATRCHFGSAEASPSHFLPHPTPRLYRLVLSRRSGFSSPTTQWQHLLQSAEKFFGSAGALPSKTTRHSLLATRHSLLTIRCHFGSAGVLPSHDFLSLVSVVLVATTQESFPLLLRTSGNLTLLSP